MRDDYRRIREGYDPSDDNRGNDDRYGSRGAHGQQGYSGERGRGGSRLNEHWGSEPDEDFRENVGYGGRTSQWGQRGDRPYGSGGEYERERYGSRNQGGRDRNYDFGRSDEGGPYGYGEGRFGQNEGWGGRSQYGERNEGGSRYGRTGYRGSNYGSSYSGGGRSGGGEFGSAYGDRSSGGSYGGGYGSGYGGRTSGEGDYGNGYGGRTYGGGEYGAGRGERSSASRSMPKNYQRSDERIRDDVCEQLSRSGYDIKDVSVEVSGGKVTLEGTVQDRYTKHAIEDCADDSMGVREVDNRIRVSPEGGRSHQGEQGHQGQSSMGSHSSGQADTSASEKKRT